MAGSAHAHHHAVEDDEMTSIREARPGDEPGILQVVADAFSSDGTRDPAEELTIVRTTWSARRGLPLIELVADEGGTVVGHLQAAPGRLDGTATLVAGVAPVSVGTRPRDSTTRRLHLLLGGLKPGLTRAQA
jgi:predicted N-acetyltransferase YhbS